MEQAEPHVQTRLRRIAAPDATREPIETIHGDDEQVIGLIYDAVVSNGTEPGSLAQLTCDTWIHPDILPEDAENFPVEA